MNTIIKMKKHPIDDLFAKKLAEHQQEPSRKAFEKFQARLTEKQQKLKPAFFVSNRNWTYYAAAAGIVIVLSIGFLNQNKVVDMPNVVSVDLTKSHKKLEALNQKKIDYQSFASIENKKQSVVNITQQSLSTTKNSVRPLVVNSPENTLTSIEILTEKMPNKIIDDSPEEQISIVANTKIFENIIGEIAKPMIETTQGLFKTDVGESIIVVFEPTALEADLIPAINQDSETTLVEAKRLGEEKAEKEKSFIAKLYGEYKHFKYGEKVDFKKLGVKEVLARVDDSVLKEDITDVRDFVQRKVSRIQRKD